MTGTVMRLLTIQPLSFISFLITDCALRKHPSCHENRIQLVMSGYCFSFYTKRHNFSRQSTILTLKSFTKSTRYHQMEKLPYHVFWQCIAMPLHLEQYKLYYIVFTFMLAILICRISQFNEISILITEYGTNSIFITWQFHPQCLGETWYLSVDMQLYTVTPLLLLPLLKKPKIGIILLQVVIAASMLTCFLQLNLDQQNISM
jgi:hypothetical protein